MNVRTNSKRLLPALIAALACMVAASATAQEAQDKDETKERVYEPEAMQIIDRYVEALGGEKAIRAHKYRTLKGEMSMTGANVKGPLTIKSAAPKRFAMVIEMEGVGTMRSGFDGKVAWSVDPMQGPMLLEGPQADDMRRQADFFAELNYKKHYTAITHAGRETFGGVETHRLRLVDRHDKESFVYFHPDTAMLVGMRAEAETPMGTIKTTTHVSEYKEFDGVQVPTLFRIQMMGMEQRLTIESVSHDPIPEETFVLPEEIKAMLPKEDGEKKENDESR